SIDRLGQPANARRYRHRVLRCPVDPSKRRRKCMQLTRGPLSRRFERYGWVEPATGRHYGPQQHLALRLLSLKGQPIFGRASVPPDQPVDLLSSGPRRLSFGPLPTSSTRVLLKLICAVEVRGIARCVQPGPHAEPIDRRTGCNEPLDAVLVEI